MKTKIKRILPDFIFFKLKRISNLIYLNYNYFKDMKRYSKHSFELSKNKTKRHMEADLIFFYHKIEKGLSLPHPKIGFGQKKVYHLLNLIKSYQNTYGWDDTAQVSLNALFAYLEFNQTHGLVLDDLQRELDHLKKTSNFKGDNLNGGTTNISIEDIETARVDFKKFANSRYSLRTFSPGPISHSVIKEAVKIAQKSPSVCNRQSWKVYAYSNEYKNEILKHQNGNMGFGNDADKILIITATLEDFRGPKERNQAFIDGGLFSMSLMYALHSLSIGTCALNLSLDFDDEEKLRNFAGIPESEVTLMMIALGKFPNEFYVADSPRRPIDDVLKIID